MNGTTLKEVIIESERQSRISAYNLHQAVYPLSLVIRRVGNSTNGWPKNFFHQRGLCKSKQTSHESRHEKSDNVNSLTKRFLAALGNSSVREYVVDSGASYHIIGISLLSKAERRTIRKADHRVLLQTANGQITTDQVADVNVEELGLTLAVYVVKESCPPLLSLGKLCKEHHIGYVWPAGSDAPYLQSEGHKRVTLNIQNNVPFITTASACNGKAKDDTI